LLHIQDYRRSLDRSRQARTRPDRPSVFTLNGRQWDLLPDVFAPVFSPTTGYSLELLGLSDPQPGTRRGSLLEIGCGTGVIAVSAAIAGHDPVVAADVSEPAARNAAMNADRHGVGDKVRSVSGDLFDGLHPDERFDVVFWHSNYVLAPPDYRYESVHERAYVDPGYTTHRRFLRQAVHWRTAGGSVLLHFSGRGDIDSLRRIADACGRELRVRRTITFPEGEDMVDHMLIEVIALDS
jgi:release factor glutamine methyltransferase